MSLRDTHGILELSAKKFISSQDILAHDNVLHSPAQQAKDEKIALFIGTILQKLCSSRYIPSFVKDILAMFPQAK